MRVQSQGREDPLKEGMATHSSILAWRIPWTREARELQSMGSQRVEHANATWHIANIHSSLTAVFLKHEWDKSHSGSSKCFCRF